MHGIKNRQTLLLYILLGDTAPTLLLTGLLPGGASDREHGVKLRPLQSSRYPSRKGHRSVGNQPSLHLQSTNNLVMLV